MKEDKSIFLSCINKIRIRAKVGRLAAEEFQVVKRMELKPSELSQQQEGASLASAPNLSLVGSTLDIVKVFKVVSFN
jgi:hypothetical protein